MSYLNSILFNETHASAGLPLSGALSHLSVPLGLVCVKHQLYDKRRNVEFHELIGADEFDNLAKGAQHIPPTRKKRVIVGKKTTKKQRKLNQ